MNSETAKALDSTYNRMQWAGEEYLLEEVVEAAGDRLAEKGEVYSKDVIYWIGYIYRYWHYYTEESSKAIYKQAPMKIRKKPYTNIFLRKKYSGRKRQKNCLLLQGNLE